MAENAIENPVELNKSIIQACRWGRVGLRRKEECLTAGKVVGHL